jgi:hypothetical protein
MWPVATPRPCATCASSCLVSRPMACSRCADAFPDAMSRYVQMVIVMTHYDRFRDRLYDRLIIHDHTLMIDCYDSYFEPIVNPIVNTVCWVMSYWTIMCMWCFSSASPTGKPHRKAHRHQRSPERSLSLFHSLHCFMFGEVPSGCSPVNATITALLGNQTLCGKWAGRPDRVTKMNHDSS